MTVEDCRLIERSLRDSLAHFGIEARRGSDLSSYLDDLAWIQGFEGDPLRVGGAGDSDSSRAALAVVRSEQLRRIEQALSACRRTGTALPTAIKMRLSRRFDCLDARNLESQDHFFELEVGGRLIDAGHHVEFAEPDILVTLAGTPAAIAVPCKRPRDESTIAGCIRSARRQLRQSGSPGVILISAEALLYHFTDAKKPHLFLPNQPSDLRRELQPRLDKMFARDDVCSQVMKAFEERCVAIIAGTTVAGMCNRTSPLILPGDSPVYAHDWLDWGTADTANPDSDPVHGQVRAALRPS